MVILVCVCMCVCAHCMLPSPLTSGELNTSGMDGCVSRDVRVRKGSREFETRAYYTWLSTRVCGMGRRGYGVSM